MSELRAADIHARVDWPTVLEQLGVPGFPSKKPRPCPHCGGRDRFVPDNRHGRGDYFCRQCGSGDGFSLLMKLYGWSFSEARRRVLEAAGLAECIAAAEVRWPAAPVSARVEEEIAAPTARVRSLMRSTCAIGDCAGAVDYLKARALWPPPADCTLRAHPSVEYFEDGRRLGRFPALIAEVRDLVGELVTVHVTYLSGGKKLEEHEPRKLLSPLTGREGCAVRLAPFEGEVLGIAEGIETALAARQLNTMPVWSALNAGQLQKFEPPESVRKLLIFADRDVAGLEAAARLMERLQGRVTVELRAPPAPFKDWNDVGRTHRDQGD